MATAKVEPKFEIWVTPDQVMAGCAYINREYGEYGYTITAFEAGYIDDRGRFILAGIGKSAYRPVLRLHVIHGDGSTFVVTVDRAGNVI